MAFRNPGFTAWFENFEVSVMGGNSRFRTTFNEYLNIAMNEFEICLSLGEISRMPSPDEIVFQFDLL